MTILEKCSKNPAPAQSPAPNMPAPEIQLPFSLNGFVRMYSRIKVKTTKAKVKRGLAPKASNSGFVIVDPISGKQNFVKMNVLLKCFGRVNEVLSAEVMDKDWEAFCEFLAHRHDDIDPAASKPSWTWFGVDSVYTF